MEYVLECKQVSKSFGGVEVLHSVDFDVKKGEIHALVGENGAGKSTLMKIISGIHQPSSGTLIKDGEQIKLKNPLDAFSHKIGIVHQELSVASNLTVAENIMIGQEPINKLGFINKKELIKLAEHQLERMGIELNPTMKTGKLSLGAQQIVEIAKVLARDIDLLILDEPTSSLSEKEIDNLIDLLLIMKEKYQLSIIFISHKLNEVLALADRTTVLRDGYKIGDIKKEDASTDKLINMMIGRDLLYETKQKSQLSDISPILEVQNLTGKEFSNISFTLKPKEILGVFGLIGSGRTETICGLIGYEKLFSGTILFEGEQITIKNPRSAVKRGICYVTEDRKGLGLFLTKSSLYNVIASSIDDYQKKLGVMDEPKAKLKVEEYIKSLNITPPDIERPVSNFSGGNQQKILLAKSLVASPKILIIDEPTRGVDVGAKALIHSILSDLAKSGIAVLVISSELPEILKLSDRVMVMHDGKCKGFLANENLSENDVMSLAYSEETYDEK